MATHEPPGRFQGGSRSALARSFCNEPRVIVGAGLAGSAAAVALARGGAPPLLLERSAEANPATLRLTSPATRPRICGEFVSTEAARALAGLGVDVLALGGRPTTRLRLTAGALTVEAALPFTAVGLTRQALDGALQRQAVTSGARLQRGERVAVMEVASASRPHRLRLSEGDEITTPTLLLACGKSDLAPLARRPRHPPEPLLGLQTHLVLAPAQARAIEGHVEVLLFEDGYAGLQPVEGGRVNLCLLVQRSLTRPDMAGGRAGPGHAPPGPERLQALLQSLLQTLQRECPLLAERLQGASWQDGPPQTITGVPYGHLHRASSGDPPGLWRLGDQAAVIPSFTGDGMAIALHSAALAAELLLAGSSAARYHQRLCSDIGLQMARATLLYRIGRNSTGRRAVMALLQRWPGLMGFIAAMTRVPPAALRF